MAGSRSTSSSPELRSMRVGDAERDRCIETLQEQYGDGRLDLDEFRFRVALALRARTEADLATLLADLPVSGRGSRRLRRSARPRKRSARPRKRSAGPRQWRLALATAAAIAGVALSGAVALGAVQDPDADAGQPPTHLCEATGRFAAENEACPIPNSYQRALSEAVAAAQASAERAREAADGAPAGSPARAAAKEATDAAHIADLAASDAGSVVARAPGSAAAKTAVKEALRRAQAAAKDAAKAAAGAEYEADKVDH